MATNKIIITFTGIPNVNDKLSFYIFYAELNPPTGQQFLKSETFKTLRQFQGETTIGASVQQTTDFFYAAFLIDYLSNEFIVTKLGNVVTIQSIEGRPISGGVCIGSQFATFEYEDNLTFEEDITSETLKYAFNNNVLRYSSNQSAPLYSTIEFLGVIKTLFPRPDGSFYFNLREMLTSLSGRFGYIDDLDADLDASGLVYDWTTRGILRGGLDVKIYLEDSTTIHNLKTVTFINGVVQLADFRRRYPFNVSVGDVFVQSPLIVQDNRATYIKYWLGYPLDFSIYSVADVVIKNLETTETYDVVNDGVRRVFVSDGRTNAGLQNQYNLAEGINTLEISSATPDAKKFTVLLDLENRCGEGHYFKWINSLGGYSYWLFHKGDQNRSLKDLGELENDFNNYDKTVSPVIQMGVSSGDTINVEANGLSEMEAALLLDMSESPAIFIFTGVPFDQNNYNDWLSVSLKISNVPVGKAKEKAPNYKFTFELTRRYTRTL